MRRALGLGPRLRALVVVLAAAQAAHASGPQPPAAAPQQIALTLFLIGDAGKPAKDEPVLASLRRDLERAGGRATVAFLGDNVYPSGLPPSYDPARGEMESRLDGQLDAVSGTGAHAIFIPGNHDWQKGGEDGWQAIKREQRYVETRGAAGASFLPGGGCPGPRVRDVSDRLRLVALDTQWWLQSNERPEDPSSGCDDDSEAEVLAALRATLAGAGTRDVVVLAHHPFVSGGPHGGHFTLRQHLFPLTDVWHGLWLPLPLIGSIYPVSRGAGVSSQDQSSHAYRHMRESLASAARDHPPLAWTGGHEHVLQVIESREWGRVLVSGTGIYGHTSPVKDVPGSLYSASRGGYMRIDFLRDGTRRLGVVLVAKDGSSREGFAKLLDGAQHPGPQ